MLKTLADEVWVADAPNRFYGLEFGSRMTVVRLGDGSLLLHSPIAIDQAMKTEIDALGPVRHIIAPNVYHHLHAKTASELYPSAKLHLAPGLDKKRPDMRADAILGGGQEPSWQGEIDAIPIEGYRLNETVFVHHLSRTLLCSDLLENFRTSDDWYTRVFLKLNGVHGKPGVSRALRMAFRDKRAARKSIDAILEHPFDRIALAHGDPITHDGRETLRSGYAWLKS